MTSRADLESAARRWIALWCAPVDWDAFERLHADDFQDHAAAGRPSDRRGFASGLADMVAAFPDLEAVVEDLVVDEAAGRVAVRWSAVGTNRGAYMGAEATGLRTTIAGIEIIDIRDGSVVRRWGEWDYRPPVRGKIA